MQHLPSPDSLPPGTTSQAPDHPNAGYLREIWHALRNGEVSGSDALLLLGTRPANANNMAASTPSNHSGPVAPAGADAPAPQAGADAPAPVAFEAPVPAKPSAATPAAASPSA